MRHRVKRAFTLVEILIVVVILGILAAIVVPQFTNASTEAQAGNCATQLQTIRSHDQFNTTVYGPDDRYRGISDARRIILVNPEDLQARGIKPGTKVDITSFWQGETRTVKQFVALPYEMPKGSAAAYFPEANPLVPINSQAEGSGTPTSKSVEIEIVASE